MFNGDWFQQGDMFNPAYSLIANLQKISLLRYSRLSDNQQGAIAFIAQIVKKLTV